MYMWLRGELVAFYCVPVRVVGTVAPQQYDLFARLRFPSKAGRIAVTDEHALPREQYELMSPVVTRNAEVTSNMLTVNARLATRIADALGARQEFVDLRV